MSIIYKVTNCINNKIYIGKSKTNDPNYFGSGLKILFAMKKYGKNNFKKEILEECPEQDLNTREQFWIAKYNSTNDKVGYNISKGGDGGSHYWDTLTDEQRVIHNKKISEGKKGVPRKPQTEETKRKIAENQPTSPEWYKSRAEKKMKVFTCVNHLTKEVFEVSNLRQFCIEYHLSYANMTYNARTKKNFTETSWSCRPGPVPEGDVIGSIEEEIQKAQVKIKCITGKYNKSGCNNPMFNRKHSSESKEKMRNKKLNIK